MTEWDQAWEPVGETEALPALPEEPSYRRAASRRRRRRRRRKRRLTGLALVCVTLFFGIYGLFRTACRIISERAETGDVLYRIYVSSADSAAGEPLTQEEKFKEIMDHPEDYPEALRDLAVRNAEAIDYVYQYPKLHDSPQDIDLSAEAEGDGVPLLLQWDTRWGYQEYGDGLLGYTGCGPTCLSMVALFLTGDETATPAAIAAYAQENGYYAEGSGSMWTLMSRGCEAFGIRASELSLDEGRMAAALAGGQPLICALGAGDFTDGGHFIVITGYEDGKFSVNDPNSVIRSDLTWSFDRLSSQIRNIWAYSIL